MRLEEFDEFSKELRQLCATLRKAYTDALAAAYWRALRDISLDEFRAHVERLIQSATPETKFPLPSQLRTTPAPVASGLDIKLREAEDISIRFLEQQRKEDPNWWLYRMRGTCAASYAEEFGVGNIWFDLDERCWRHHP